MMFTSRNVIPSPLSGRNFTLKTYTTISTPTRMSCDHWVVSRMKTRISFSTSSRRIVPKGASRASPSRPANRAGRPPFAPSCALL